MRRGRVPALTGIEWNTQPWVTKTSPAAPVSSTTRAGRPSRSASTSRNRSLRSGSPSSCVSASSQGCDRRKPNLASLYRAGGVRRDVPREQLVRAEQLGRAAPARLDVVAQRPDLHREEAVGVESRGRSRRARCGAAPATRPRSGT